MSRGAVFFAIEQEEKKDACGAAEGKMFRQREDAGDEEAVLRWVWRGLEWILCKLWMQYLYM